MILRPPRSTRSDTLFPYTTLFRSYRAAIALGHKLGQQPAVIDMGVAEDDGGQSRRIEGKGFPVERFKRPRTLEEPTVDQHRKIAVSQLHAGAGDRAGRTVKGDFAALPHLNSLLLELGRASCRDRVRQYG